MVAASYPTVVVAAVLCLGSTAIVDRGEQADSSRSHLLPCVARAPPKAGHQLHNVDRHVVFGAVEGPGGKDGGSGHEGGEGGAGRGAEAGLHQVHGSPGEGDGRGGHRGLEFDDKVVVA